MKSNNIDLRLPFEEIVTRLNEITVNLGFDPDDSRLIAHTHTQSSCDGVESHGLNRFPRFVEYVKKGYILPDAHSERIAQLGAWERWDGHLGAGIPNAHRSIYRAVDLAKTHGLGGVALRNTNHWMRAGTYGWLAAERQCMAICMTNTIPNMAPWGGQISTIGNNPVMLAVPRKKGPVVLDMATSQFSYGRMEDALRKDELLPFSGGWDKDGRLTDEPGAVLDGGQVLPAGYWKGSGLSILVDLMVSLLADGQASHKIGEKEYETGLSQLFICIDMGQAESGSNYQKAADAIIQSVHSSTKCDSSVYYPGERALQNREYNMEKGVPVDEDIWRQILELV